MKRKNHRIIIKILSISFIIISFSTIYTHKSKKEISFQYSTCLPEMTKILNNKKPVCKKSPKMDVRDTLNIEASPKINTFHLKTVFANSEKDILE